MKIDSEIEKKDKKPAGHYLKLIGFAFVILLIFFSIGFYLFNNSSNNKYDSDKKIFTSKMSNSANYSMTILLNLDNYLIKNNYISYDNSSVKLLSVRRNNIIKIDAKEIVDVEEFAACNGTVIIDKDSDTYNYTVNSKCGDDPEDVNSLTIKRFDNINNLGLNALHKLESIDDGYIGLFDYSKNNAEKCKNNKYECVYDGFALAKLNEQGDISNIKGISRSDLKLGYEKTIQIENLYVLDDAYYVSYSIGGNEAYKEIEFVDDISNWIVKYDSDLNVVWNTELDNEVPGIIKTIKVGNTLGLVESYYDDNSRVYLIDPTNGSINDVIEFDYSHINASTLININDTYYTVEEERFCNPVCENKGIKLNKYDNAGKIIFSKAILNDSNNLDHTIENPNDVGLSRNIYANNQNIIIYNYENPYRPGYVSVFDQDGEFVRNHAGVIYDRIIQEYDNQYSLIQSSNSLPLIQRPKNAEFNIDTFNKNGELISNKYYEIYNNESFYKNGYLITETGLIGFSSSYDNNGVLLLLYFD